MQITQETVAQYAALANLELSPKASAAMAEQLATILNYVNKINELDFSEEILSEEDLIQPMPQREDLVGDSLGTGPALANAPDRESDHFLVPKGIKVNR